MTNFNEYKASKQSKEMGKDESDISGVFYLKSLPKQPEKKEIDYSSLLEQIQQVLQVVYQTNVSAQNFDALKKFFTDLPECENCDKPKK